MFATRNAHKTREFAALLGREYEVEDLSRRPDVPSPEETGATFLENAALKAASASSGFNGLVVADDSGLEVDSLAGAPGVWSARFAGPEATDQENVARLLELMKGLPPETRTARFRCVLALAEKGKFLGSVEGVVEGRIAPQPRGRTGFGYDPVFVPDGLKETFAEMPAKSKNLLSHRACATAKLRELLISILPPAETA